MRPTGRRNVQQHDTPMPGSATRAARISNSAAECIWEVVSMVGYNIDRQSKKAETEKQRCSRQLEKRTLGEQCGWSARGGRRGVVVERHKGTRARVVTTRT